MLSNLISNAIKFTTAGEVRIVAREIERNDVSALLEFSVADSGIGIPPDRQERLFKAFSQVDSSTTRQYGGTGLGLSIVRSLAALMGGDVGVESEPGKGARFWFRIRANLLQDSVDRRRVGRESGSVVASGSYQAIFQGRVQVVEDTPVNCRVIEAMLRKLGVSVSLARNGEEGVAAIAQSERPDLVLMDIQMPIMDGYAATTKIRQLEGEHGWSRLPIVALTANAFEDDRTHCLAVGMDGFLAKPIAFKELQAVLEHWLPVALPGQSGPGQIVVDNNQAFLSVDRNP